MRDRSFILVNGDNAFLADNGMGAQRCDARNFGFEIVHGIFMRICHQSSVATGAGSQFFLDWINIIEGLYCVS